MKLCEHERTVSVSWTNPRPCPDSSRAPSLLPRGCDSQCRSCGKYVNRTIQIARDRTNVHSRTQIYALRLELLRHLDRWFPLRLQLREQLRVLQHLCARRPRDVRPAALALIREVSCSSEVWGKGYTPFRSRVAQLNTPVPRHFWHTVLAVARGWLADRRCGAYLDMVRYSAQRAARVAGTQKRV